MIEHVYGRVRQAEGLARVVVLTDDARIAEAVEGFGGEWEMTPAECRSGTDRVAYAARSWEADAIINVQGDEPLIDPAEITVVARHLQEHPEEDMVTLALESPPSILDDPNVVKVVVDRDGYALYFSRAAIPYPRQPDRAPVRKHVGLYGYRRTTLLELARLAPTSYERSESLEQLRALEHGVRIKVLAARRDSIGVDTQADLEEVEELLASTKTSESVDATDMNQRES